jgi:Cu(I)/Ag(I) efflux system membrane fusion protein
MRMDHVLPALIVCVGALSCSHGNKVPEGHTDARRRVLYYQDPMHPAYRSDRPGVAPDCNMELAPVYADASVGLTAIRVNEEQSAAIG